MSNGKGWTNEGKVLSSNDEATRAVSRDQFRSQVVPNSSRDETRIAHAETFPNQDATKAISADLFYQATAHHESHDQSPYDSSEDETRALTPADFNFQALQNNQAPVNPSPQPNSWHNHASTNSAQGHALASSSYPEPYSKPQAQDYPSPQPRRQNSSSLHNLREAQNLNANEKYNSFPSPMPNSAVNAETQPNNKAIDQQEEATSNHSLTNKMSSAAPFQQEDLTQAHLKSHALAELITEHRYQDQPGSDRPDHLSRQSSYQRVKRTQLIIYSSIGLSVLIIVVALSSAYFTASGSLLNRIDQQQIALIKLKAPYALNIPANLDEQNQRTKKSSSLKNTNKLLVYYTQQKLLYTDQQSEFEHEISLQNNMLQPKAHPLRLNGTYLPMLIHQLESFWPKQNLNELILASSPSASAGAVLDLLITLTINNERKGSSYERYNLLINKTTNQGKDLLSSNLEQSKTSSANNQPKLAMLPFKILFKNDDINRNEFLQIKWSQNKKTVFILGPKRNPRSRFQILSQTLSHQEDRLATELKEKIDQIGALKGILIAVPRNITLTELALWLSVSAPYPVYLIPPKVSF